MAKRIAENTLNASTIDILNVIRQNASPEYQSLVPKVTQASDIPKVGEVIYGTPAFSNQFINALVNRIALVRVNGATFNNPYSRLKKGYLEFGETIEDIFVNIAKVFDYSAEKGEARELKRYLPDVKSAFHVMNWRVMYPVTIQDQDLKLAFYSMEGVQDLIAKIVDSVYTASEYDEFLLFKYLIIKAVSHGKMYPVSIGSGADMSNSAVQFRGISNLITFMLNDYNEASVKNNTPKSRQCIFMDSFFNAQFDVEVLASAFNMDKANFMGSLFLIDSFSTFDNERWSYIRQQSDGIEEVTPGELAVMASVKAVIIDERWFQVYDNNNKFTEKYVASGLYWNYFYHVWKTVSHSPFANAIVFGLSTESIELPSSITAHVSSVDESEEATVLTTTIETETPGLTPDNANFVQTEQLTTDGIAIQPYGAVLIPKQAFNKGITLTANINGTYYKATSTINASTAIDTAITLTKQS